LVPIDSPRCSRGAIHPVLALARTMWGRPKDEAVHARASCRSRAKAREAPGKSTRLFQVSVTAAPSLCPGYLHAHDDASPVRVPTAELTKKSDHAHKLLAEYRHIIYDLNVWASVVTLERPIWLHHILYPRFLSMGETRRRGLVWPPV
jgi:hypothetical protein